MAEFLTYKTFETEEEAKALISFLEENGISTKIYKAKQMLDHTFIGEDYDKKIELKLLDDDFQKANDLLDQSIIQNLNSIEKDHYLYSFTDVELMEVIKKPAEWSRQDHFIAKYILENRKTTIAVKNAIIIDAEIPILSEKAPASWLFIGYVLCLFGFLGLFSGLALVIAKKVLPDGSKIPMYTKDIRIHGSAMVIVSTVVILLSFIRQGGFLYHLFDFFGYPF